MEEKKLLIIIGSIIGGVAFLLVIYFAGKTFLMERENKITMESLEKIGRGINKELEEWEQKEKLEMNKRNYEARIKREQANKRFLENERRKERIRLRNEEIKMKEETDPSYNPANWHVIKSKDKTCYYHKKNRNQVCETVTTE